MKANLWNVNYQYCFADERKTLFYSTFESETGMFVKPFVKPFVMRFCLCAFLENSTREKFLSWPSHSLMAGKYANQFEWKNRLHFTDPWPVLLLSTTRRRSLHRIFRLRVSDCASPNFVAGVLTGVRWLLFRSSKNFLCKAHVFLPAGLQCEGGFANKHRKFIAECKLAWWCSSDTWRKSHASRVTPVSRAGNYLFPHAPKICERTWIKILRKLTRKCFSLTKLYSRRGREQVRARRTAAHWQNHRRPKLRDGLGCSNSRL